MTHSLPRTPVTQLLTAVLRMAAEHHRAGRRPEAASLYREVLALDARNADALFLLAVLAREDGRLKEADRLLAEAGRWAATRERIDAERRLVQTLLRQPAQKPVASWVARGHHAGDGCALTAIAHA